mgnify:FL=1
MTKTLLKNTFREIANSKARFISILAIIALGVGFFAGIKATVPSMYNMADEYYSQSNLMDYRLVSTVGFDKDDVKAVENLDNVKGILFDSAVPGSGKSFDWSMLERLPKNQKMLFLAGGLTADNVSKAVAQLRPFAVDVSSGVELADKSGKNFELVRAFIENARNSK